MSTMCQIKSRLNKKIGSVNEPYPGIVYKAFGTDTERQTKAWRRWN